LLFLPEQVYKLPQNQQLKGRAKFHYASFVDVLHHNIKHQELYPGAYGDRNEEYDGIILVDRTCIFVEVTTQREGQTDKIKKFINKCELFINSDIPLKERFGLFNKIPRNKLSKFEDVNDWRYLYIGTSPVLRTKQVTPMKFPDADEGRLHILWPEEWQYLRLLAKSIGEFGKYELFAAVGLQPPDEPGRTSGTIQCNYVEMPRCKFSKDMSKSDVFVTSITSHELLSMCRVPRFQHLPFVTDAGDDGRDGGYQRLLNSEKLKSIRKYLKSSDELRFPNSIIVVGAGIKKDSSTNKLNIPFKYASLDLIDGQHRLFAFAGDELSEKRRRETQLLTTIIQYEDRDRMKFPRNSGRWV
tara:strand:+ start:620 stop:1687 length:1068 start_codon:yes stop_codon:yes gene_type:complete